MTNTVVKPHDLRQQFGASVGGPIVWGRRGARDGAAAQARVFYFAAVDVQRRANDAVSSPGYGSFFALTATQRALLGNRGVSTKATDAALTYLDSLTGTVPRREDQQIGFGKVDWQISAKNKLSMQGNYVRWNSPGGVRSEPVLDRGAASLGNAFGKVDSGVGRLVSLWTEPSQQRGARRLRARLRVRDGAATSAAGAGHRPGRTCAGDLDRAEWFHVWNAGLVGA